MKKLIYTIAILIVLYFGFLYKNSTKNILTQEEFTKINSKITAPSNKDLKQNKNVLLNATFRSTFSTTKIDSLNTYLYSKYPAPKAIYEIDKYTVKYNSQDEDSENIEITAQLFVPKTGQKEKFPIYVFGQGTTGLGDNCAPSKEQPRIDNWGDYQTHMLSYASQGYIVMFPDYEGFNDLSRIHHYFNAQLEAQVLLDGTRAVYNFFENKNLLVQPLDAVFYAGYSQGGHAVFSVSDLASTYAPELPIKGIISQGGTTDIKNLLIENPALAPYLVYAYSDFYGTDIIDPAQILKPNLLSSLEEKTGTTCIGKIYQVYSSDPKSVFNTKFYNALFNNTLAQDFSQINKIFEENSTGLIKSEIPALIVQGNIDPIVTTKSQKEFMTKTCEAGNNITYIEYPGVHHYQTRQISFKDSLNWMQDILEGEIPRSDCDRI